MSAVNPVARLIAALLLALVLVLTIDPVSAGVALALELLLFPFAGLRWGEFWRRTAIVWIAAPLTGLTIVLYGQRSGRMHLEWFLVQISDGSIWLGLATFLRVLAIGLPAVVLFARVDPTDFGDGLAQVLRLPARFVLGAFAGIRLVGLFADDRRALELARRARGVADRGRLRRLAGLAFALFVLSIRRGSALATAMEARGFGSGMRRTWARPSPFGLREWGVIGLGALLAGIATAVAVVTGSWNLIVG
ncbi:MAG TPA: energy-coupling factor transporter transmembrane component T [Pseudolysinimonas sp.]|nr:energy-coupling factor transporter transmembrane component T [Pseudolysinimonas sp.]